MPTTTLSRIARRGSGSACRSLFGGFVFWQMGSDDYGSDSFGRQIAPESHWPDMHALICIVSGDKKNTSSTSGMQRSVKTSTLLDHRIEEVVPDRMEIIVQAIVKKKRMYPSQANICKRTTDHKDERKNPSSIHSLPTATHSPPPPPVPILFIQARKVRILPAPTLFILSTSSLRPPQLLALWKLS